MAQYVGHPEYEHGGTGTTGVLLANLGTPDDASPAAVRRFLAEFLWDPRVVETPRWIWWFALHGVILRIRPARSAHAYRQIWTDKGSPLLLYCREVAAKLESHLRRGDSSLNVALGMTYGAPSIASALEELRRKGAQRLLVLPLYPQYSATTTASVFDRVAATLKQWRWLPELRFIGQYHDDINYVGAIAASIRQHWQAHGKEHLLFSFHGAPRNYLLAGDPYHCQCHKTARLVAEELKLPADEWTLSFQSRLGRGEWLRPYTDELLLQFAAKEQKRVTVVCPGFATDNLETLEEIAIRNRAAFLAAGGERFDYIPALNATPEHIEMLAKLATKHLQGWETGVRISAEGASARERALRLGAQR